jgi:glycosyltransferase involved in cell wall biosynthesis
MTALLVFGLAFAVQVGYWLLLGRGFQRVLRRATAVGNASGEAIPLPSVSVVVAARDEAARLPALLAALARQTHPDFEVVVVDDASTDGTADLVRQQAALDARFRLVQVGVPQWPRKKHALTQGIATARHRLLAFTDADCVPGPDWLMVLARWHGALSAPAVLVGYGPFFREPGLLNRFIRYETLLTAFSAAAAIGWGRPYTAAGRNLSYPRAVFEAIDGFAHSHHVLSGDDDLLVQEVARRNAATLAWVADPAAFVPSPAPSTWPAWFQQKRRHVATSPFYARALQYHLRLFHATNVLLWLAPWGLGWGGVGLLALKWLGQGVLLGPAFRHFQARDLRPWLPLGELLLAVYALLVPFALLSPPRRWDARRR